MPDFPIALDAINSIVISPQSPECLGVALAAGDTNPASGAFPSANRAIFIPFNVYRHPITIKKILSYTGVTGSGNIDVGIYDLSGTKIVSIGSTAQSGASAYQVFDITDTVLYYGQYYLACAMDGTTGTLFRWSISAAELRNFGMQQMATAFPLPATATFAAVTGSYIPWILASRRTVT